MIFIALNCSAFFEVIDKRYIYTILILHFVEKMQMRVFSVRFTQRALKQKSILSFFTRDVIACAYAHIKWWCNANSNLNVYDFWNWGRLDVNLNNNWIGYHIKCWSWKFTILLTKKHIQKDSKILKKCESVRLREKAKKRMFYYLRQCKYLSNELIILE